MCFSYRPISDLMVQLPSVCAHTRSTCKLRTLPLGYHKYLISYKPIRGGSGLGGVKIGGSLFFRFSWAGFCRIFFGESPQNTHLEINFHYQRHNLNKIAIFRIFFRVWARKRKKSGHIFLQTSKKKWLTLKVFYMPIINIKLSKLCIPTNLLMPH